MVRIGSDLAQILPSPGAEDASNTLFVSVNFQEVANKPVPTPGYNLPPTHIVEIPASPHPAVKPDALAHPIVKEHTLDQTDVGRATTVRDPKPDPDKDGLAANAKPHPDKNPATEGKPHPDKDPAAKDPAAKEKLHPDKDVPDPKGKEKPRPTKKVGAPGTEKEDPHKIKGGAPDTGKEDPHLLKDGPHPKDVLDDKSRIELEDKLSQAIIQKDKDKVSEILGTLSDEDVRSELSKVVQNINKGNGGPNYLAIGVDAKEIHLYSVIDGVPRPLYSGAYDPATDSAHAADFDPNLKQKILQDINPGHQTSSPLQQRIENLTQNPTELRLFAAIRNKNGAELRSALAAIDPSKLDSQIADLKAIFNYPTIGTTLTTAPATADDKGAPAMAWQTLRGKGVVLYSPDAPAKEPKN
jgi:hypothetical protein